jgi:hypothetical protein
MARSVAQVDARLTDEINTRSGQLKGEIGSVLNTRLRAVEARQPQLTEVEVAWVRAAAAAGGVGGGTPGTGGGTGGNPPPIVIPPPPNPPPGPLPSQVYSASPIAFSHNGETLENVYVDSRKDLPMDLAGQVSTSGTVSAYGKGYSGCTLRNATLRGRQFGVLMIDMPDLLLDNVLVLDVNYAAFAPYGDTSGLVADGRGIVHCRGANVALLRNSSGLPSIGDPSNAYGVILERGTQGGGSSAVPHDLDFQHCNMEDSPLWMCWNMHQGIRVHYLDCHGTRAPRNWFNAGPMEDCDWVDCTSGDIVHKSGGSGDSRSFLYSGFTGAQSIITNFGYKAGTPPPEAYGSNPTAPSFTGTHTI